MEYAVEKRLYKHLSRGINQATDEYHITAACSSALGVVASHVKVALLNNFESCKSMHAQTIYKSIDNKDNVAYIRNNNTK